MTSTRASSPLLLRTAVVFAGAALLTGCAAGVPAASARSTPPDPSAAVAASEATGGSTVGRGDTATEQANLAVVTRLFSVAFDDPDSAEAQAAAATSIAKDAVAHGTGSAAGPAGLLAQFAADHQRVTGAQMVTKHTAADGDLVAIHYQITADPSDERTGEAAADVFRLSRGKIVERWSFDQPVPQGKAASGNTNTMFSDLYEPAKPSPAPTEAQEEKNRVFAVNAYDTLFRDRDVSILDRAFDPAYLQHNPVAPNGTAALKGFFSGGASFPAMESTVSLADGDLVWTLSQAEGAKADDPYSALDIFRVDGGLIREHWDVVPATPAS
jgi:predicted SnoaL-like aldol condensation-catalyzing enzyme